MKNTKSKIVIPALGLILLSTAASISGSVAWFTANRTATFTAGNFAVVKTTENLVYDLTAGAATTITGNAGEEVVNFADTNALTHASYDHLNNNILKARPDGTAITNMYPLVSTASPTAENLQVDTLNGGGYVYSAATWQLDFTLSYTSATRLVGLFVDWDNTFMAKATKVVENDHIAPGTYYTKIDLSDATPVTFTEDSEGLGYHVVTSQEAKTYYQAPADTGKGFRIALLPIGTNASSAVKKVLAKNQTIAGCTHVWVNNLDSITDGNESGSAEDEKLAAYTAAMASGTAYTGTYLLASNTAPANYALPDEGTAQTTADDLNSYLGVFPFTANTNVTLSFMCVAWFEGTDDYIDNDATVFETMASSLSFSAIDLA